MSSEKLTTPNPLGSLPSKAGIFSRLTLFLSLALVITLSPFQITAAEEDNFDDDQLISDPFEGFNRAMFWFNNQVDYILLEPLAEGYDFITPKPVKRSLGNFFENLNYPVYLLSDVVQLKFGQAGTHTGRFLINSTLGLGGLFDVASEFGLEEHQEDFGTALAHYGVGSGPYLVLPFLGPSSLRDAGGLVVDRFVHPSFWVPFIDKAAEVEVRNSFYGISGTEIIDTRASLLEPLRAAQEASLDYYSFLKNTYYQRRQNLIYDGFPPEEEFFDDEEFEEEEFEEEAE